MRTATSFVLCALLAGFSASASAAEGARYFGLAWMGTKLSQPGFPDFEPEGVIGKLGYNLIGQRVAVEAHLGYTPHARTESVSGTDVDVKVRYVAAVFGRYNIVVADKATIYALGGYARAGFRVADATGSAESNKSGVAYGAGIELYGNATTALSAEYVHYFKKDSVTLKAINIGFVHRF